MTIHQDYVLLCTDDRDGIEVGRIGQSQNIYSQYNHLCCVVHDDITLCTCDSDEILTEYRFKWCSVLDEN